MSLADELNETAHGLRDALHPQTRTGLADMVRDRNGYRSNLIEGHNARLRDRIDPQVEGGTPPDVGFVEFLACLRRAFHAGMPRDLRTVRGTDGKRSWSSPSPTAW